MRQKVRDLAWAAATSIGIPRLMRRRHRRDILILMYHAVVDEAAPFRRWTHVPLPSFEWQVDYLRKRYTILPLQRVLVAMHRSELLPDNCAVITFDDGFRSTYSRAFPVLRRARIPATVFLSTGLMESAGLTSSARIFLALRSTRHASLSLREFGLPELRFSRIAQRDAAADLLRKHVKRVPATEKDAILHAIESRLEVTPASYPDYAAEFALLSWAQVEEMHASGLIEFGAHGAHHEILNRLPHERMRQEILASCAAVRERLGYEHVAFAYPNGGRGDFDEATKTVLREAEALGALSSIDGFCALGDDLLELKRIGIGNDVTRGRFAALCSGLESGSRRRLGATQ